MIQKVARPEASRSGKDGLEMFVSYSHRDEKLCRDLCKHLTLLRRSGLIRIWHDKEIRAGENIDSQIGARLESADVVLLLVSADFLSSEYCYSAELRRALERHQQQMVLMIPIILRPVEWQHSPLGALKALPKDGRPVASWANRDEALFDVAKGIRQAIEGWDSRVALTGSNSRRSTMPAVSRRRS
jgi:hypothetical protein